MTTVDADDQAERLRVRQVVEAAALGHMSECKAVVMMRSDPAGDVGDANDEAPAGADETLVTAPAP